MIIREIFVYVPFVFWAILVGVWIVPARIRTRFQAIAAMVLLACAGKFLGFESFGGDAFAPELPEKLIWAWDWAYSGMCILLALSCAWGIYSFVISRTRLGERTRRFRLAFHRFALPLVAWALSAWGVANGVKAPELVATEIKLENLPAELDGYRIVQIADIHASAAARAWRTRAIVDQANAAKPDLIVLAGDYSDGNTLRRRRDLAPLKDLAAKDGIVAVSGNHEYYYDYWSIVAFFHSIGIDFLDNECVSPRPGLVVAGVPDTAAYIVPGAKLPDVDAAFANATNGCFRVLVQHRPNVDYARFNANQGIDRGAPTARFDLQLSGHTHGGIAPVLDRLVAAMNGGLVHGVYPVPEGGATLVSRGAGQWAGFPIRFFNPPEINLITLHRR